LAAEHTPGQLYIAALGLQTPLWPLHVLPVLLLLLLLLLLLDVSKCCS
jgi:hypothetical protein